MNILFNLSVKDSTILIGIFSAVIVIFTVLFFLLKNKHLRTVEIICSIINYIAFSLAVYFYIFFVSRYVSNTHSWADVFIIIFELICSAISILFSIIAIFYSIKARNYNKILLIINIITIFILTALFVSLKLLTN